MRTSEIVVSDRPRERLERLGPEALREEELLALLIGSGCAGRSALDVARDLLRQPGIRERLPAAALAAAIELVRRWDGRKEDSLHVGGPRQVWERLCDLRRKRKEHFVALYLNARNRLLHVETVSIGTLTASLVHPREVFGPAIERGAAGIIVAHNHPSGDPQPSPEDRSTTRRLERAGELLGVPVLDHVVVAEGGYVSLREAGAFGA